MPSKLNIHAKSRIDSKNKQYESQGLGWQTREPLCFGGERLDKLGERGYMRQSSSCE